MNTAISNTAVLFALPKPGSLTGRHSPRAGSALSNTTGHVEKFGLLPDGKDRFREDRREKARGRDCKACREKKQQQEREAADLRRAQREKRKVDQGQTPRRGQTLRPQPGRLPDGSRFEISYDAAKEQWSGTLTVPTPGGAPATDQSSWIEIACFGHPRTAASTLARRASGGCSSSR